MMGQDHSTSGLLLFLLAELAFPTLLPAVLGGQHHPVVLLAGAVVTAGAALLPDLDCKGGTAATSLGPVTGVLSWVLRALSKGAHSVVRTRRDKGGGAHRALTHTAVFAAGMYFLVRWLCDTHGVWAVLGVLFLMLVLAQRGLPPKEKPWLDAATSAGATALAWIPLHDNLDGAGGFLGLCVAAGCVIHCLGDAITKEGVPFLWPVPLGGQCWHVIRLPRHLRLRTGGWFESHVVRTLLIAGCVLTATGLFWPGIWPVIGQGTVNTLHYLATVI